MVFLLIIFIGILMHISAAPFPAQQFFNAINETDAVRASYLCASKELGKCCSCDRKTCYEDCCIDVFWDTTFFSEPDMKPYLEYFAIRFKKLYSVRSCQPIKDIDRSDFKSEKLLVKNSKDDEACALQYTDGNIRPIVYNANSGFYSNKECAKKNGVNNVSHIDISVGCKDIKKDISVGMIFNETLEKRLNHCQFNIDRSKDKTLSNIKRCISKYKDDCNKNDENYNFCKMYLAPTNGYKNKHCLRCKNHLTTPNEKLDNCYKCENYHCDQYDRYLHNFILSFNDTIKNFVITSSRQKFPVLDFVDSFTEIGPLYRCEFRNKGSIDQLGCFCDCDLSCLKYRTCCLDVLWEDDKPISVSSYKKLLIDSYKKIEKHECVSIFPSLNLFQIQYYMIANCLSIANDVDKSKCDDEEDTSLRMNTPVIGIDGNLYRNVFCARCNGNFRNKPVEIIIGCPGWITITSNTCVYEIEPKFATKHKLKKCHDEDKKKHGNKVCRNINHPYYDLCHSYKSPYGNFKNPHCYMCSEDKNISFAMCAIAKHVFKWSLLISFNDDISPSSVINKDNTSLINFCSDPLEFSISRSSCKNAWLNGINTSSPSFDNCIALQKPTLFIKQRNTTKSGFFEWQEYLSDLGITDYKQEKYYSTSNTAIDHILRNISYDRTIDILSYYNKIQTRLGKNSFIISTVDQPVLSETQTFKNTFPLGRMCYEPIMLNQSVVEYLSSCGVVYNGTQYQASDIVLLIEMNTKRMDKNVVICKRFHMSSNKCHHIILTKNITFDQDGSFLHSRNDLQEVIQVEDYFPIKNGVAICSKSDVDILYRIEIILSLVGCSLSILCYIIILVTYCLFATLRNTPGKNTISLTLSLLIGDTMYLSAAIYGMTGPHDYLFFCKTIAITMHFFIVNAHFWCIAISYDMMLTFSQTIALDKAVSYATYSLVTTLCSLSIIILAIILDSLDIIKTGYGDKGICVPYECVGRLLFYVSPIAVSISLSFGFLIKTIYSLYRQKKTCKGIKHRDIKSPNITLVALKLCFVLGIPELIGFLQIISKQKYPKEHQFNNLIGLIYTTTRSFRGIFICLVYILRERVLNLYKTSLFCSFSNKKKIKNSDQPTQMSSDDSRL